MPSNPTVFHYPNRSYEKNVTTGEETLSYYHGDRLVAVKRGGVLSYLHQDHLGSTSLATDTAGSTVSSMKYLPYGEERSSSGTLPTSRRFTGQRWDNPANLYDYNARSYDPALGRFISADTIVPDASNPQAFSRYSYVINNPLKYTDPAGTAGDASRTRRAVPGSGRGFGLSSSWLSGRRIWRTPQTGIASWWSRIGALSRTETCIETGTKCGSFGSSWRSIWWRRLLGVTIEKAARKRYPR